MKKICFFVNCHSSPNEISGGDIRFREIVKRINNFEKIIITSKFGYDIYVNEKINACYFLISRENVKGNIIFSYLKRTFKSFFLRIKISEGDILYSTSDFIPDVLPAFFWKLRNKNYKWIALSHLLAPNPFYGSEQQYLKIKKMKLPKINEILYKLNQLLSFNLIKIKADKILVVNSEIRDYFISCGIKKEKILIVNNGIDFNRIQKIKSLEINKYDACFVGRFHPQKGIFDLIKIWEIVCKQKKEAKLAIIGNGTKEFVEKVKHEIRQRHLIDNIILLGFLEDEKKFEIMKSSSIFLCPSYYESFAIVIAEAAACGLPVVAYDLPIYKNIYENNILKVPIGDINKFADIILKLLCNPYRMNDLNHKFQYFIRKFDWNNIAETELRIIESL